MERGLLVRHCEQAAHAPFTEGINMTELKTKLNDSSVDDFLNGVENEKKRADSFAILNLMKEVTGEAPKMWGSSIVGFGSYHYKYESGREGDWFVVGFSPRKQSLTLYIMSGFAAYDALMESRGADHPETQSAKQLLDEILEAATRP